MLQQRTWLLHWSLFVFFNLEGGVGLGRLIEFMLGVTNEKDKRDTRYVQPDASSALRCVWSGC